MQKRLFLKNAFIMTLTSLLLRSIGIIFRIYISNRVGAEGMGLYQLIVSVYVLAASFASAGLTTAVTRLCTDELARGNIGSCKQVLHYGIVLSLIIGFASALILIIGANFIATVFLHDIRAVSSLKILTVSLPFMGVSSCIKGYFLSKRNVTSSSLALILEQLVRIAAIAMIFNIAHIQTVEGSCFAILLGDSIAEASSCLFMIACYHLDKPPLANTSEATSVATKGLARSIMHIALPITGGRYLSSGLRTVENILVPTALSAYTLSRETALAQFGKLKGMAIPILFFPSSFLNAFTALLIPEISEANTLSQQRRLEHTVQKSLQITLLSSILIGCVFWVLAPALGELIYHDSEVGEMMRVLAPLAPIMYLESVIVGILKGLDQQTHSLLYSVLDSASRILLIPALIPSHGIIGFFGIMVLSNLLTCSLNLYRLLKTSHVRFCIGKWLIKPAVAAMTAVVSCDLIRKFSNVTDDLTAECLLFGLVIIAVYSTMILLFGCIQKEDLVWFKPLSAHMKNARE